MHHNLVCLLLLYAVCCTKGARILGIFPSPFVSHQLTFQAIMKALAARGHNVTVISPNPLKTPVPNYQDVDLSFLYEIIFPTKDHTKLEQNSPYGCFESFISIMSKAVELQLSSPQIQEFIRSNESKYDLVFLEGLAFQSYHGLVHHLGSPPVIGVLPLEGPLTAGEAMGNPTNPAFVPNNLLPYGNHMTFYERLQNTLFWLWTRYKLHTEVYPAQEAIMRKYFGSSPPPVAEAERNMSLLILGSNWVFNYPIPLTPSVLTIHSLHVKTTADPLPKDLQNFLDEAQDGVIYFSLGSHLRSDHVAEEKIRAFLEAFSELPQKILWKWESDSLPGKPPNVKTGKWLPQQDILAHPNVKLFITQCGMKSFQEAVYHGVPILAVPFFGDQKYNAKKVATERIGVDLPFQEITKGNLLTIITAILNDPKYRDNMRKMSALSKDEPESPLNRAVWWAEYVIRHNGAKHLRSAALDLAWYQYLLLDVAAFLFLILAITVLISYLILKIICMYLIAQYYKVKSKHD